MFLLTAQHDVIATKITFLRKKVHGMFMCIFKWLFIHIRSKSGLILLLTFHESSSPIEWGKPFLKMMMEQWHWLLLLYFTCKNELHWIVLFLLLFVCFTVYLHCCSLWDRCKWHLLRLKGTKMNLDCRFYATEIKR